MRRLFRLARRRSAEGRLRARFRCGKAAEVSKRAERFDLHRELHGHDGAHKEAGHSGGGKALEGHLPNLFANAFSRAGSAKSRANDVAHEQNTATDVIQDINENFRHLTLLSENPARAAACSS